MIYDRPYMSTSYDQRAKNVLLWLIGINVGIFVLQSVFEVSGLGGQLESWFAMSSGSLGSGKIWTPITYSFLHGNLMHVLLNMLGLFFLGRAVLFDIGSNRFLQAYFSAVLIGALAWFITSFLTPANPLGISGYMLGASAGVSGLLALFACLHPNRDIQVLLFLILPIRVKPKVLAWVALGISGFGFLFSELQGGSDSVAHSAHLGGMLAGWLYFKQIYSKNIEFGGSGGVTIKMPNWLKTKPSKKKQPNYNYKVNISQPRDLKVEVDRILDKINSKGFGALTDKEKEILDEAGDLLKRR